MKKGLEACLDSEGKLIMAKLEDGFNNGSISPDLFTNTLKYDCDYRAKGGWYMYILTEIGV